MQIFLYEFVTGGGWYSVGQNWPPPSSLVREGWAMLDALAEDFCNIDGVAVTVLRDVRSQPLATSTTEQHLVASAEDERDCFGKLAAAADWTIVVAPEIGGALAERCYWVNQAGGRLLGPSARAVEIASDKQQTAEWLAAHAIPTPHGIALGPHCPLPLDFRYPAVLKPCDGAGSLGIRYLAADEVKNVITGGGDWRLETFCPGVAASDALLCGPRGTFALAPASQRLASDGSFAYLGGELPLAEPLAARAVRLAKRAVDSLPQPLGYLGVDLVLGDDPNGRDDVVFEINPRLTTSYVGLRALARCNLAAAMLAIAEGLEAPLCFDARPVKFDGSGNVFKGEEADVP